MPQIECRGVYKTYNQGIYTVEVLKNLELTVKCGERIALIGASGSGKSTLLHLLGGLDLPDAGGIFIAERGIHKLNENQRCHWRGKEVGFIYQFHHLLAEFTVSENVRMPLLIQGWSDGRAKDRAEALLERVGLSARLKHKPDELSGGERQRVAICRALAASPSLVLADEPTGNLDNQAADTVMRTMLEMNAENRTTLMVATHNLDLIKRFDRVCRLKDGAIEAVSP